MTWPPRRGPEPLRVARRGLPDTATRRVTDDATAGEPCPMSASGSSTPPAISSGCRVRRCQAGDLPEGAGRVGKGRLAAGADTAGLVKRARGGYSGVDDGLSRFGKHRVPQE